MKKRSWVGLILKSIGILALLIAMLTAIAWWATKPEQPGEFYDPPAAMAAEPGVVIRTEPFTRMVPAGARGLRMLYTTTKFDGTIAPASAIVLIPERRQDQPSDVVAWTHGTTGVAPACAPSVMAEPFANVPALNEAIAAGWVIVATDYIGLGTGGPHPYLIGEGQARSALDSLRAVRQIPELNLSGRTVIWGHSQGGNAALWTGLLAPEYAPEIGIDGVAAAAPASDLVRLVDAAESTPVGKILSAYIITAYSGAYPDVSFDDYIGPLKRPLVRDMSTRCLEGRKALFLVGQALVAGSTIFAADPTAGPLGERLRMNTPSGRIAGPTMVAQGGKDELVLPEVQGGFVDQWCRAGQPVEYVTFRDQDHLSIVAADSPLKRHLIDWTKRRFNGEPAAPACETREH